MTTRHIRNPSAAAFTQNLTALAASNSSGNVSPALLARIEEKKTELANLRELRDLSGQLASQMEMLEEKLATLSNGTEAVALVLGNWADVLKAIGLASSKIPQSDQGVSETPDEPKPNDNDSETQFPQTLVRIPVEHSEALNHPSTGS